MSFGIKMDKFNNGLVYQNDVEKFLTILRDYACQKTIPDNEVEKFIKERVWRVRAGGRDLDTGGTGVLETGGKKTVTFFIRHPREEWLEWAKTLGPLVREGVGRGRIENGSFGYPFRIKRYKEGMEVSLKNIDRADRFFLSHLRAVANKTACCCHCRGCAVECPTGALQMNETVKIAENLCIHCAACLTFVEKGCLAAKSLTISRGGAGLKGLNRYQQFGMRKTWLEEYFRDPENWWHKNSLGNRQFEAMRVWLREAEIVVDNKINPLGERLREWGAENPLTWAVVWTNLARNSTLVGWYLSNVPWGSSFTKKELVNQLGESLAQRSRENAITALAACPPELLTDSLKQVLEPEYKTKVLYRSRGSEAQKRLQEILDLGLELVSITEAKPDVRKLNTIAILQRFINEQAIFGSEKNAWKAKANQDIGANSLQESL